MIELSDLVTWVVTYWFEWTIVWLYEYDRVESPRDIVMIYWFEWSIVWLYECDWVERPRWLNGDLPIWVIDYMTMWM